MAYLKTVIEGSVLIKEGSSSGTHLSCWTFRALPANGVVSLKVTDRYGFIYRNGLPSIHLLCLGNYLKRTRRRANEMHDCWPRKMSPMQVPRCNSDSRCKVLEPAEVRTAIRLMMKSIKGSV